jgi:hypothetical protein
MSMYIVRGYNNDEFCIEASVVRLGSDGYLKFFEISNDSEEKLVALFSPDNWVGFEKER